MINAYALLVPFLLQGFVISVDEFHFHLKRKLPRWERIGHPIDTAVFLSAIFWILFMPPTRPNASVFLGLSCISCLLITKDEFVHRAFCSGGEHLLHSFLFVLHPLMLVSAALLWPALHLEERGSFQLIIYSGLERSLLVGYALATLAFCLYQITFWNFIWKPRAVEQ